MTVALFTLTSSLHAEAEKAVMSEKFITDIEDALGTGFVYCGEDFSDYGTHDTDLIYVRTGGTEGLFKALGLKGNVRLLTSGKSNSLAASMEILSYLRANGQSGEILHGTPGYIASRIMDTSLLGENATCPFIHKLEPCDLGGIRLGVVGRPSDWLISSGVDYAKAKEKLNVEIIDIPMSDLLGRISGSGEELRSIKGSEAVYDALKGIIAEYRLGGLTIRCFDLLDTVHNTGCLALARLNAEGIPASCEGDIPALISMVMLDRPGFQCNLSRIDGDELLFAHCTVPLNMLESYRYDTHFESGIGTAIKGELPLGKVLIYKISPDLETCVSIPGEIVRNTSEACLCRTQIVVRAAGARDYFLRSPLANHHIIAYSPAAASV